MTTRREFFRKGILAGAALAIVKSGITQAADGLSPLTPEEEFKLPPLPYAYDALEPFIDRQTMEIHHGKHHQGYVTNLNKAVKENSLGGSSLEDLLARVSSLPPAVRNHGGGHYNHTLFWSLMRPAPSSVLSPAQNAPKGHAGDAISSAFGSFEKFRTEFSEKAAKVFGSGWTWLVKTPDDKLVITTTSNQDNPLMDLPEIQVKGTPVLGLDVWEHAYYLKYQNKRTDYVSQWWNLVNWDEAAHRLDGK